MKLILGKPKVYAWVGETDKFGSSSAHQHSYYDVLYLSLVLLTGFNACYPRCVCKLIRGVSVVKQHNLMMAISGRNM